MKTTIYKTGQIGIIALMICSLPLQTFAVIHHSGTICPEDGNTTLSEQNSQDEFCSGDTAVYVADFTGATDPEVTFFWDSDLSGIPNPANQITPVTQSGSTFTVSLILDVSRDGGRIIAVYEDTDCPDDHIRTGDVVTVNTCGIDIEDPCTCLDNETLPPGNGQFSEIIVIQGISGEDWTIVAVEGLFMSGTSVPADPADAFSPGDPFQVDPLDPSKYNLEGIHIDGNGYSISATNGDDTLSITNQCFYPRPQINLLPNYCINFPAFDLEVTDDNHSGTFTALINGIPATVFNPANLGPGVHAVHYTFSANPSGDQFPGCEVTRTVFVEVFDNYDGSLSCFSHLNAGLGPDGTFTVTPDVLLSDDYGCFSTFEVNIMGKDSNVLTCEDANVPWVAMVSDPIRGGGCTSTIIVEDKLPPVFVCEDVTIACTEDIFSIPVNEHIEVSDNCGDVALTLIHQSPIDNPNCNTDYTAAITRTLQATDLMGNSSTCVQTIYLGRPDINDVEFPDNVTLEGCAGEVNISTDELGYPTLDGEPVGFFCELYTTYSDMVFPLCEGSQVIKRMWTVTDHCGAGSRQDIQEILIDDNEPPVIDCPQDITIDTDPGQCSATYTVVKPGVTDNCVSEDKINVLILVNNIPRSPGMNVTLNQGENSIEFIVNDRCFNYSSCIQTIEVVDNESPSLLCDPTTASLNENGEVVIIPQDIENNSYFDNCAIADTLLAKMDDPVSFQPMLTYDCSELGDNQLIVQVSDVAGNANTCMINLTIQDKLPPEITFCPEGMTVFCTDNSMDLTDVSVTGMAEATDNCEVESITNEDTILDNDPCNTIISRRFTATDSSGNSAECTQIITVIDATPPTITVEAMDTSVECDGSGNDTELQTWLNNNGGAMATDGCSNVTWSNDYNPANFSSACGATGSVSVTFTVMDGCGNPSTTSATFTIEDNTDPTITVAAQDETVECDGAGNMTDLQTWLDSNGNADASDDCSDVTWSNDYDPLNFIADCGATGSVSVTFTATDACGNSSTTSATFTIEDNTAPTVTIAAQDETVECDGAGNTTELQTWLDTNGGAMATDICSDVIWSNDYDPANFVVDCGGQGSVSVTFTVTDACGNSSTTSATFTIEDNTAPTVTIAAQDETVICDGLGNTDEFQDWLNIQGNAEATDICSDVTWSNDYDPLNFITDCGATGSVVVTFTATDACGNSSTTSATFTIEDNTDPTITVTAQDETVECDGAGNMTDLQTWLDSNGNADASDDCSDVTWSNDYNPANFSSACGATGSVAVTFTATDACGNPSTTSATFTIEDNTDPTITVAAQDETVECDGAGNMTDLQTWLDSNGNADASDDCSDVTWSNDYDPANFTSACGATGSVSVTFTATDACGNSSTTSATFTIEDNTAPTVTTAAQDETVECDGLGNTVELQAWLDNNGGAMATDICSDVTWSNDYDPANFVADCGGQGSVSVTFTATDDCGNSSTTSATFTIEDNTAPTVTIAAQDETVICDGSGNTDELQDWLNIQGNAEAADICSDVTWSNDYDPLNFIADCGATGSVSVTFTAMDACGNSSTTSAAFTIEDDTDPTITAAAQDETVECDGAGNTTELQTWLNNNGGAMATDGCSIVTWSNDYNPANFSSACGATGSVAVTFTATDACGNSSTASATFTIEDNTDPTITVAAQDETVECDGAGNMTDLQTWLDSNGNADASDDCSDVTWSNDYDPLNFIADCGATGSVSVTFTATDACGNSSTTSATFTIEDNTAPTVTTAAQDETVECDGLGNTVELQTWLDTNGGAMATDICSDVIWSNDYDPANFVVDCGGQGSVSVTFTVTDACGNSSTTSATFTIEDDTAPTVTTAAQDETVECDGSGNTDELQDWLNIQGNAEATDICSDVTWSNDYDPLNFIADCGATGSVSVTFTAMDACGNSSTTSATFTIEDDTDPTITVTAQDETVECDGAGNTTELQTWLNTNGGAMATDDCSNVTWSNDYNPANFSSTCGATGSVVVTFTATDACGNSSTTSATFTIEDNTAPNFINCSDTLFLLSDVENCGTDFLLNPALYQLEAIDDCDNNLTIGDGVLTGFIGLCDDVANPATASGAVTFSVSDACGNENQCVINVEIVNDVPADVDCPNSFDVVLDSDTGTASISAEDIIDVEFPIDGCFTGIGFDLAIVGQTTFDCSDIGSSIDVEVSASICGSPEATCTVNIEVLDPENIEAICPPDITIFCGEDIDEAIDDYLLLFDRSGFCIDTSFTTFEEDLNDCPTGQVDFTHTVVSISGAEDVCTSSIIVEVHPDDQFTEADITWPDDFSTNCVVTQFPVTPQFAGGPDLPGFTPCQEVTDNNIDIILVENDNGCRLIQRNWVITDNCTGNEFPHTQFINIAIEDVQVPAGVTVANDPGMCGAMIDLDPLFVPNCTGDVEITNNFNAGGADASGFYPIGTTTVTFTVTNGCPDVLDFYQVVVTVIDTEAPEVSCSQGITISCSDDLDAALQSMTFSASDNCPELMLDTTLTFNLDNCGMGTINVLFSAMDQSNNAASCNRLITVLADPDFELSLSQFDLPDDITLACGENIDTVNTGSPTPFGGLLCADLNITFDDVTNVNTPEVGCSTITRTFTIEDACTSGEITHVQTITISGDIPNIISGPSDISVPNDLGACGATVTVPELTLPACATDLTVSNDFNNMSNASGFYEVGSTEVVFTVTNNCGNIDQWTVTITVEDTESPIITCPADTVVSCEDDIDVFIEGLTYIAEDNCEIDDTAILYDASGIDCGSGIVEVTFQATDIHNNTSQCTFDVEVTPVYLMDNQIQWPETIALSCDQDLDDTSITGVPIFDDFCGSPMADYTDGPLSTGTDGCTTFERLWTVEDICSGEVFSEPQTIQVPNYGNIGSLDDTPILEVVEKDEDECGAQVTVNFPEAVFCAPDVTISNTFNDGGADASGFYPVGTTEVTYTIENNCEILFTAMAMIVVVDLNAPIINCPIQSQPVSCMDDLDQVVANWGITIDEPCPVDTTINYEFELDNCGVGTVDFTFLVTDNSMNTASCVRTITIESGVEVFDEDDVMWPESPLIVEDCDADINPMLLGSEPELLSPYLCLSPMITFEDEEVIPTDDPDQYCAQYTRTWTITADCDGSTLATFEQTIYLQPEGQGIVIDGFIKREDGSGVHGVVISSDNNRNNRHSMSGTQGFYQLATRINSDGVLITPSREDGDNINISGADILSITKHIKGIERIDSPYKIIAADVNRDGRITVQDIVILRELILNRIPALPFGNWRFIDADYIFENEARPLKEIFAEQAFIPFTSSNHVSKDFIAVHLGDVFNTANTIDNRATKQHSIFIDDISFEREDLVTIQLSIDQYRDVESCQFALTFDHQSLLFQNIQLNDNILSAHVNLDKVDEGLIMISWDYLSSNHLTSSELMDLSFKAVRSGTVNQAINLSHHIIKPEITMSNHAEFRVPVLEYVNRASQSLKGFELFQNEPNPFNNFTKIPFFLPEAEDVELTIYDLNGTVVHYDKVWFEKGYQSFILNNLLYDLSDGTYFYRVKTNDFSATKKMVRVASK